MTDADGARIRRGGDEPEGRRAPEPVLRAIVDASGLRAASRPPAPLRAAVEAIAHPARWLGAGAAPDRTRGGLVFGAWRLGWPLWPQPIEIAALLCFEPPSPVQRAAPSAQSGAAPETAFRVAALIFSPRQVAEDAEAILSPGAAWFDGLGWTSGDGAPVRAAAGASADAAAGGGAEASLGAREAAWLQAPPPQAVAPRPGEDAQIAGADAASLLRRLQDEVGAEAEAVDPGGATRPIGAVWGASDDEAAFWRAVGALSGALPRPMRAFVSAASGFQRTPDGVAIAHGPAIESGRLEGGEAALAKLADAEPPTPRFPGAPGLAAAALRRWLRDVERPSASAEIAAYLMAPQSGRPESPPGQRSRIARLRRAVAMAEEETLLGPGGEPIEDVDAARLAELIAGESGDGAEAAWDALRRTEPARFYWSALTLRALAAVDGAPGDAERGPVTRLAEIARLIRFDDRVAAALAEPGAAGRPTTPLSGPAFRRRLARAAGAGPDLLGDDPPALLEPTSGEPARWIARFAGAAESLDDATRRRLADASGSAAQAAALADLPGRWREAAAAFGAPPGRKDAVLLAIDFGKRWARALDRGALSGSAFWRRAYELALREAFDAPKSLGGDLRVIREGLGRDAQAGSPGRAAAAALAEAAASDRPTRPALEPAPRRAANDPGPSAAPPERPAQSDPERASDRAAEIVRRAAAQSALSRDAAAAEDAPARPPRRAKVDLLGPDEFNDDDLESGDGGWELGGAKARGAAPGGPGVGDDPARRASIARARPDPLDADPLDADPLDVGPLDDDPLDADPRDADPLGVDPLGVDPLGVEPLGVDRPAAGARGGGSIGAAAPRGPRTAASPPPGAAPSKTPIPTPGLIRSSTRSQDVTLARARLAHWRDNFERTLDERYEGKGQRNRVGLSRDGRTDLDAEALDALGRLGADLDAADALDEAAAPDIAWTIRQFIALEFDPSAAPIGPPEPPEIAEAWAAFADGETADDLKRPETFFLFFITKVAQRGAPRGVKADRIVLAFDRFLTAPKSMFLIGDRKITAPYTGWLRDHAFETSRREDAARLAGVDDGALIRRLHRAFLFLACIRVFLDDAAARELRAEDWKLWQPISGKPSHLELFDPHAALVDRLERFLLGEGEDGLLYARIYEKIASQNNLYHADGLGHLSRQIRRRNNAPVRPLAPRPT